jgi:hypothetical protein
MGPSHDSFMPPPLPELADHVPMYTPLSDHNEIELPSNVALASPRGSTKLTGLFSVYAYRFVPEWGFPTLSTYANRLIPPSSPIGSGVIYLPVVGS